MNIVILGAGRIGSVFAFQLARAGHDVTAVCRGARLKALQRDGAIVTVDGRKALLLAAVEVLNLTTPFDLAIVTIPEHQFQPLIAPLAASAARVVLLMFNSFSGCKAYRDAIGAERLQMGFPNMAASLSEQLLHFQVDGPGMTTAVPSGALAEVFDAAGLPTVVERDMDAYLRSHVAMVVPLFIAALWMWKRPQALSLQEAWSLAAAWRDGFRLVRSQGHKVRPGMLTVLAIAPRWFGAPLLWAFARSAAVRELGAFGPAETRWLIDSMVAYAPERTRNLFANRP
jgi:2-dehydropantoate 2-reductase